jgi:hypothetical protein
MMTSFYSGRIHWLLLACSLGLVSGCDRIEGQAKDFARSTSDSASNVARDFFVSDLQKLAEATCMQHFTAAAAVARSSRTGSAEPPKVFVSGNPPHSIDVRVIEDGKYELQVPLFRRDEPQGLYTGRCRVEAGRVLEATLSSPF